MAQGEWSQGDWSYAAADDLLGEPQGRRSTSAFATSDRMVLRAFPVMTAEPNSQRLAVSTRRADDPTQSASAIRLLLVDDNADAVDSMAMLLTVRGATVKTASLGAEVVDLASAFQPHVVVLDISLPDMDGYEVCGLLRREPWAERIGIVALTGWGADAHVSNAKGAVFDHHVLKPAHPDALLLLCQSLRRD